MVQICWFKHCSKGPMPRARPPSTHFKASVVLSNLCRLSVWGFWGASVGRRGFVCIPGLSPSSLQYLDCHSHNHGSPQLPSLPHLPGFPPFPPSGGSAAPSVPGGPPPMAASSWAPCQTLTPWGASREHWPLMATVPLAPGTQAAASPDVPHFLLECLISPSSVPCVVLHFLLPCRRVRAGFLFLGCFSLSRSV